MIQPEIPVEDYFYDTEFLERGPEHPINLISLGMKRRRDGALYYAVSSEFDMDIAWHWEGPLGDYWLRRNVLSQLPLQRTPTQELVVDNRGTPKLDLTHPTVKTRAEITRDLRDFFELGHRLKRRLWAWYADYDHVVLSQLWGTMVQLPHGMPMFTHDLKQIVDMAGNPDMPLQTGGFHNALADAEHLYRMFAHCQDLGLLDRLPVAIPAPPAIHVNRCKGPDCQH